MFERFRKKKEIIHRFIYEPVPNTLPKYIVNAEMAEKWKKLGYESKDEVLTYLKTLDRVELMKFQDAKQFDGTDAEDAVWEATNDTEWMHDYPIGEHGYKERIPSIVKDVLNTHSSKAIDELAEKVDGMQKKLDRIQKLIENAEFKLCGKDALKL